MKKIIFAIAFLFSCLLVKNSNAQISFSLGINIGSQPEWGPVGYDHADYYYMPDIDTYYDVNAHNYVYYNNNVWVRSAALPPRYRGYDVYHGYKVVINHPSPWRNGAVYRQRYAGYRGRHDQGIIRDSHDDHYRNHWHGDNGNHRGWDHGDHGDHGDHDHGDHDHGWNHGDHGHDR